MFHLNNNAKSNIIEFITSLNNTSSFVFTRFA